ncbi:MAG TPA: sigma-70 family RNA polymerase sigma factor [Burkholderiaceae bacterium]|nr:sigma-70 family RNA polymerase sigma factor [Burkholderiaceae bacterium]
MAVSPFDYEATLLACAAGKQNALRDLFQHEAPRMLALSTKMFGRREEAEDAVRDTFILLWKNAGNYDESTGTARAWIYSILRYRVLSQIRQQSHNPGDDTTSISSQTDVKACLSTPVKSLAQLDDMQRAPLLMAFYHGQTFNQMAARLMTPVELIRTQLRTGLDAVQGRHA